MNRIPVGFAALTIGLQITWPLTHGQARTTVTILVVIAFFLASLTHAWIHRGTVWTATWVFISLAFGLLIEVVGTRTGLPFGPYSYTQGALGWDVLGVPLLIPLAWAMMSYPALLVGRRLGRSEWAVIAIAAWALAAWDLFLDPQMVGEGYWVWDSPSPALPGVPGIPVGNFLGWLVASVVLMAVLNRALADPGHRPVAEGVPAVLYLWTWVGGVVANMFFLGRPAVALIGGVAMGVVAVPYLRQLAARNSVLDPA